MMNAAMSVWGHPGAKPAAPLVSRLAAKSDCSSTVQLEKQHGETVADVHERCNESDRRGAAACACFHGITVRAA